MGLLSPSPHVDLGIVQYLLLAAASLRVLASHERNLHLTLQIRNFFVLRSGRPERAFFALWSFPRGQSSSLALLSVG